MDLVQRVGDVLERREDSESVLRGGLPDRGIGGALAMTQRSAVEDRLGQSERDVEEASAAPEHLAEMGRRTAHRPVDRELRQSRGSSDADLRRRRMQRLFGDANVGTLLDDA